MSGHGLLGLVKMEMPGGVSLLPVQQGQATAGQWVIRETSCKGANWLALNHVQCWSLLGRHLTQMFKKGSLEISEFSVNIYGCGSYTTIPISMWLFEINRSEGLPQEYQCKGQCTLIKKPSRCREITLSQWDAPTILKESMNQTEETSHAG